MITPLTLLFQKEIEDVVHFINPRVVSGIEEILEEVDTKSFHYWSTGNIQNSFVYPWGDRQQISLYWTIMR